MNKTEREQLNELEKKVEGLSKQCEVCREMQDERMDRVNDTFVELKEGQQDLVKWHIKNYRAVIWAVIIIVAAIVSASGVFIKFAK